MKENSSWGKKFLTVTSSLAIATGSALVAAGPAQALPATAVFVNYEANDSIADDFVTFLGGTAEVVDAPAGNDSGKALKFTKAGTDPVSGVTVLVPTSTNFQYTDAAHPVIRLDYYSGSSAASPVQLKVEKDGVWSTAIVKEAQPGWNHLAFDMSENGNFGYAFGDGPHPAFDKVSIFPNFGASIPNYDNSANDFTYSGAAPVALGDIYYIDNISINDGTSADVVTTPPPAREATSTLLTFETADALGNGAAGLAGVGDSTGSWEGAVSSIENAPAGGNGGKALKILKHQVPDGNRAAWWEGSIHPYAGVTLLDSTEGTVRYSNAGNKLLTMNFYSPNSAATPVQVKVDPNVFVCASAPRGWSKLTFDLSTDPDWSASTEYKKVSIMPNWKKDCDSTYEPFAAGSIVDNETAYYIDNVALNGATTPAIPAAVTRATITRAAALTGTAKKARVLTAAATFGGSASTKTYQWYRCTAASSATGTAVPASSAKCTVAKAYSSSASYTVSSTDVGKYIRVVVKAHNTAGDTLSLSKTTAKVVN